VTPATPDRGVDYAGGMRHLQSLAPVALVTTGRTGSDFLQSLLDGHPEVLTFNGSLQFYADFLPGSVFARTGSFACRDIMDEFVGRHIDRFRSRYDVAERKDRLGPNQDQTLDLDTQAFRNHAAGLLEGHELTPRNLLLAVYGAYHLCLNRDLFSTRILFHHAHRFDELQLFVRDHPNASVIVTTRDPRANFVSVIEHGRELLSHRDSEKHLYHCLNHILADSTPCAAYGVRYAAVRLEDLPRESAMRACADWIGVSYSPGMMESTWGDLQWWGDRLSPKPIAPAAWTPTRTDNNWRARLSRKDRYLFNALMYSRLRHYQYPCEPPRPWDALLVPLLLCLPLGHERRFFTRAYIRRDPDARLGRALLEVGTSLAYFVARVRATLRHYWSTSGGRMPFRGPWIGGPEPETP
jgi:sulfotransferase family protein